MHWEIGHYRDAEGAAYFVFNGETGATIQKNFRSKKMAVGWAQTNLGLR